MSYEYKQLKDMKRYGKSDPDTSVMYYRINTSGKDDPFPTFNVSTINDGKLNITIGDLDCENNSIWMKITMIMNQDKAESINNVSAKTKFEKFQPTGIFGKMCRDLETQTNAIKQK